MIFEDLTDIQILEQIPDDCSNLFTRESVIFTSELERSFRITRKKLLDLRDNDKNEQSEGKLSGFLESTKVIREEEWTVTNSFLSENISAIQIIELENLSWEEILVSLNNNSENPIDEQLSLLKPRNLSINEENFLVDEQEISACIFDFGFYFFQHQNKAYICLSGLENHHEARLWNDIFLSSENTLDLKVNSIKACLYIDSVNTLFQLEEILYELKDNVFAVYVDKDFYEYNDDFYIEMSENNRLNILEYVDLIADKRKLLVL